MNDKCKAILKTTGKKCNNSAIFLGYCLLHVAKYRKKENFKEKKI